jgi:hypothetical protein
VRGLGRVAAITSALVVAVALTSCGDEPGYEPPEPTTTTNPIPQEVRGAALLDTLAAKGDAGLFDHRYVAVLGGGAAVLFVGTKDDLAIAYFCDPASGSAWMKGSSEYSQIQAVGADGSSFQGGVVAGKLSGSLDRTPSNAGDVALTEDAHADLTRERGLAKDDPIRGSVEVRGRVRRCDR